MTIGASIVEPLHALGVSRGEARARVREVLTDVGHRPGARGGVPRPVRVASASASRRRVAPRPASSSPTSYPASLASTRASVMTCWGRSRASGHGPRARVHDLATVASIATGSPSCSRAASSSWGHRQIMSAPHEPYTRALDCCAAFVASKAGFYSERNGSLRERKTRALKMSADLRRNEETEAAMCTRLARLPVSLFRLWLCAEAGQEQRRQPT